VVGGLIALVVVLAAASAAGFVMRSRQGRFRAPGGGTAAGGTALPTAIAGTDSADPGPPAPSAGGLSTGGLSTGGLSAGDLGAPLGARATLVQFSTAVCAYCGPTRDLLAGVARDTEGVSFVEIDAADRMDLTRRLHVMSTPTVLVLDALGGIASRASGPPRKAELLAAVGAVVSAGGLS
jgi:thioredoxin family protein